VGFITGRRALEARRMVGVDGATYAGNHGLELLEPGADEPAVAEELAGRAELARELVRGLDDHELAEAGLRLEDKGPIQALHWRGAPDAERSRRAADAIAAAAAERGLFPHRGRQVLELRPTEAVDKGSAARALISGRGVDLALFGGDDRTDLDAFDALGEMAGAGDLRAAVRVGVSSDEAPEGLGERSDIVVGGTAGFLDVLRALAEES
jgi:trehalose-phosphatase